MKTLAVLALLCNIVDLSAASANCKQVNTCPQFWFFYNGGCFYFEEREMNWTRAQDHCQSMGGNLASIKNVFEHRQIQMFIRNGTNNLPRTWVGGTNQEEKSIWRWIDGQEITYSEWCPGEPNSEISNQRCLQINHSNDNCWDDDFCTVLKASLCDAPATYASRATLNGCAHQFHVFLSLIAFFFSNIL